MAIAKISNEGFIKSDRVPEISSSGTCNFYRKIAILLSSKVVVTTLSKASRKGTSENRYSPAFITINPYNKMVNQQTS